MTNKLIATNLIKHFYTSESSQLVLDNISIQIPAQNLTVITGTSGSGKSTLLSLLSGLEAPDSGEILFSGVDICQLTEAELAKVRNQHFGFIFQSAHFIPYKSLLENTLLPLSYSQKVEHEYVDKAKALLSSVGLLQHKDKSPSLLSGGEQQRMAFVRALILEPDVLFADEPTANLDYENSKIILSLLRQQVEQGKTVVMASHDKAAIESADVQLNLNKKDHRIG